jgi:Protein of unknown function (DUF4058)
MFRRRKGKGSDPEQSDVKPSPRGLRQGRRPGRASRRKASPSSSEKWISLIVVRLEWVVAKWPKETRMMPSPFPGMDPYLEAPTIWPDLHDRLATEISAELNQILPGAYYARIEMRPEVGIVEDQSSNRRRIVPDVAVVRRPKVLASEAVAVIERPRRELSVALEVEFRDEPVRHHFVEIRDVSQHRLVTLIEILSPSNKRPGPDRDSYARKQREVLDSDASLVEIDLLRDGRRILADANLELFVSTIEPAPSYLVLIN